MLDKLLKDALDAQLLARVERCDFAEGCCNFVNNSFHVDGMLPLTVLT